MYHFLTTILTSPILGSFVGVAIVLTLLGLLVALSIYAGTVLHRPADAAEVANSARDPCRMTRPYSIWAFSCEK